MATQFFTEKGEAGMAGRIEKGKVVLSLDNLRRLLDHTIAASKKKRAAISGKKTGVEVLSKTS